MAVPTEQQQITYLGNGSTVTPYAIPFPFLATEHIFAAATPSLLTATTPLAPSAYVVTRLPDGSGGSLRTLAAVPMNQYLVIFRELPLTQPSTFELAGPFPAKTVETAFDRLLMMIQQLAAHIFGGARTPSAPNGAEVLHWNNNAARGTVKPAFVGQLGVQNFPVGLWVALSTIIGDWLPLTRPEVVSSLGSSPEFTLLLRKNYRLTADFGQDNEISPTGYFTQATCNGFPSVVITPEQNARDEHTASWLVYAQPLTSDPYEPAQIVTFSALVKGPLLDGQFRDAFLTATWALELIK